MEVNEITAIEWFRLRQRDILCEKLNDHMLWNREDIKKIFEIASSEAMIQTVNKD